jgi:hypothetical protein
MPCFLKSNHVFVVREHMHASCVRPWVLNTCDTIKIIFFVIMFLRSSLVYKHVRHYKNNFFVIMFFKIRVAHFASIRKYDDKWNNG